jgi:hypothetical protein
MVPYNRMMDVPRNYRLDRQILVVEKLGEKTSDRQYWRSKSPAERFEALELLRRIAYGYDPATERLQRVLEVTQLERAF